MTKLLGRFVVAVAMLAATLAPQAPAIAQSVPDQGPGGPILVINSPSSPFGAFYAEVLRNEGFNAFAVANLSSVSATTLQSYDVVILAQTALTAGQVQMFTNWVNAGGNLIAMRPDAGLAPLLGVSVAGSPVQNGYLLVNTAPGSAGYGIVGETIQYFGTADRYTLNGASEVARLFSNATTATTNAAVTIRNVGSSGGQAVAFAYDLATSLVYARQGNPAWVNQERDGLAPLRSDDLYFGAASGDVQQDWVNLSKAAIPQADEQQRLLANLIQSVNLDRKALPRFWYFPRGEKAVVVMTGDDHGNNGTQGRFDQQIAQSPPGCSVEDWECVRSTSYIFPFTPLANASTYAALGFEIGLHVNTGCANYTAASLEAIYAGQTAEFTSAFPSVPALSTQRHHCIAWSGWATAAKVQRAHGMRLDTTYYFWPPTWVQNRPGFMTGSAMAMRFADNDGTLIDVYQAATQMTDESGQAYPYTADELLDWAIGPEGYYGAFVANMHTDVAQIPQNNAIVSSALARGVPIVSANQLLRWLDGRNGSSFGAVSRTNGTVSFTVAKHAEANGLRGYIPVRGAGGTLSAMTRNGASVAFTTEVVKGIDYAFFDAESGNYIVTYQVDAVAPTVTAVEPSQGSADVSRLASAAATFSESIDPVTVSSATAQMRDAGGALVTATVSYDSATRRISLVPAAFLSANAAYTVTIQGGASGVRDTFGNPLATDYVWSFTTGSEPNCPCGAFSAGDAPANPDVNDAGPVELGVRFTVDSAGYVGGIRFYKGAGNSGTHTGSLWTSSGQLLASAASANETASGWQQIDFAAPVAVSPGTVYVASYHAPNGHYAADLNYFASGGVDAGPVNLLQDGVAGGNGLYAYSSAPTLPTNTYAAANYWVDVAFSYAPSPGATPPSVAGTSPVAGASQVAFATEVNATFSEPLDVSSVSTDSFQLRASNGALVASSLGYDVSTSTLTLIPSSPLAPLTMYSATVKGGATGVRDLDGNSLPADHVWSFTTDAPDVSGPTVTGVSPTNGANGVARSSPIIVAFSEPLNASTVNAETFELRDAAGDLVAAAVTYSAGTARLVPALPLASASAFTATVRGGAEGVRDLAGNALAGDVQWSFTSGRDSKFTSWAPSIVPAVAAENESKATELGVKFSVDVPGSISGIRFFKGPGNTGTHVGNLWTSAGQLLTSAVFTSETSGGWQEVSFPAPMPVNPGVVYVASYHAPNGHYAIDTDYFADQGVDAGPVNLLQDGVSGGNGVYAYAASSQFPTESWHASNYWVDVVFTPAVVDVTPPTVTSVAPANGSAAALTSAPLLALFDESIDPATLSATSFVLRDSSGMVVPAAVNYDASAFTASLTPTTPLAVSETYTATLRGGAALGVRDVAGNSLAADYEWTFTTGLAQSFSAFSPSATPQVSSENDPNGVELGVKFTVDIPGTIVGVRFFKGPGNTGAHVGNIWSAAGQLLTRAAFTNESVGGWQQVAFSAPVTVTPGNVYVASYYAPNGHYSVDSSYFANSGVEAGPVNLLKDGVVGGNGVYAYSGVTTFPSDSWAASNYWVDVVFQPAAPDTTPPTVTSVSPANGLSGVTTITSIAAAFDESIDGVTVTGGSFELRDSAGQLVPAAVAYNADASAVILTPNAPLAIASAYTATLRGGASGVRDVAGNPLVTDYVWSFTTSTSQAYTAWGPSTTPDQPPENDQGAVELGVKFTVDIPGAITGVRFYKGPGNTGTHVGNLWTASGQLLASAVFANETATGWQQASFGAPVPVQPGIIYVASYFAPNGNYSASSSYFTASGLDAGPVNLLQDGVAGGNGVYAYGAVSSFPGSTWQASNYWVDVVFTTSTVDTTAPTVTAILPPSGGLNVSAGATVIARFNEVLNASTVNASTFELRDAAGTLVPAAVSYDSGSMTAALDPVGTLQFAASYTVTIRGGVNGVRDPAGNALASDYVWSFTVESVGGSCTTAPNAIVAENCLPGNPASEWDVTGVGDPSIQGFATEMSVDQGQTVSFKIDTDAAAYTVDIYRLGYYGGLGARKVATVSPAVSLPQVQPSCLSDPTTGLVDCGNWSVSASWQVPSTATSGIYIARPKRADTGGASHIVFVVRDDNGTSDLLFQTADTTWQAYNTYGGNSFYTGSPAGRAYKVSYNRPFITRIVDNGQDWLFNAEYPMLRWLEANGYDMSYTTGIDSDRRGGLLLNHRVFLSVGHDEYWSGGQRANVEAARNAGINLAFFSGNEVFWKTRWEPAMNGQAYRTLVSYKETHANGLIDPQSPPGWTGTWRDPRFSPPAEGGRPENSLTGTIFTVNGGTRAIQVPAEDGQMRFWRNTSIANLAPGTVATLTDSTLGYEWDSDVDNGYRPAGLVRLSSTTATDVEVLQDYGSTYAIGTAEHHLTLYKHQSGALVFGAGTIQWPWGLDGMHDRGGSVPDSRMQQATVNLLADMQVQPATLQGGLFPAAASSDGVAPTSSIAQPANGATVAVGSPVTISGTAADAGGGVVGAVEVSVDGGATWHPAQGRASWVYTWTPASTGVFTIRTRAADDSGNLGSAGTGVAVTVN